MRRLGLLLACACLLAVPARAQRASGDGANGPPNAVPVRCVNVAGTAYEACGGSGGPGGGTTDTDDGSVAGAQVVSLGIAQSYAWNGAVWARITFGQSTMANSLPVTLASDQSALPVTGTFFQATQPVSLAAVPTHSVNVNDGIGTSIPSSVAPSTFGDRGLNVRPIDEPRVTTSTAISAVCLVANIDACGAGSTVEISLDGETSATFYFFAGTLAATITADYTIDGTQWLNTTTIGIHGIPATSPPQTGKGAGIVVTSPSAKMSIGVSALVGARKLRVRLSAYTGGTANVYAVANKSTDVFGLALASQVAGNAVLFTYPSVVSVSDGSTSCVSGLFPCTVVPIARTVPPLNTETGVFTRNMPTPTTLTITATAAVATLATATLPAGAAGVFHYITNIQIQKLYSIVGVAAGAGVICTSTNLPGTPTWTTEQLASPAGTVVTVVNMNFSGNPLKSSVAATNTTVTCPLQTQTIWRINVTYYTGS